MIPVVAAAAERSFTVTRTDVSELVNRAKTCWFQVQCALWEGCKDGQYDKVRRSEAANQNNGFSCS